MEIRKIEKKDFKQVKKIYYEAFPKREQKPFRRFISSWKKGLNNIWVAMEDGEMLGFVVTIPHGNIVLVEYLAVNHKMRSRGTGTALLNTACDYYNQTMILLIEKIDYTADNNLQRIARKKFYARNGFGSSDLFINSKAGDLEIMCLRGTPTIQDFIDVQRVALGRWMFAMSNTIVYEDKDFNKKTA